MAKEIIFPQILDSVSVATERELDFHYFSAMHPQIPEPISPFRFKHSLELFCDLMSGQRLAEFMDCYRKESAEDAFEFLIRKTTGRGDQTIGQKGMGSFYMDSDNGFVLGVRTDEEKLWVGAVGVVLGKELDIYDSFNENPESKDRMCFDYPFPVIVQIQGNTLSSYDENLDSYAKARKVQGAYKWERALIGLVLEWVYSQKVPAVYLLPSEKNRWFRPYRQSNFHLRYDVSAERMGFKMQPNGLYGLSLLGDIMEDKLPAKNVNLAQSVQV